MKFENVRRVCLITRKWDNIIKENDPRTCYLTTSMTSALARARSAGRNDTQLPVLLAEWITGHHVQVVHPQFYQDASIYSEFTISQITLINKHQLSHDYPTTCFWNEDKTEYIELSKNYYNDENIVKKVFHFEDGIWR